MSEDQLVKLFLLVILQVGVRHLKARNNPDQAGITKLHQISALIVLTWIVEFI